VTEVAHDAALDRRAAVEHVRAHCPALIAALVAMARVSKDGQDADGSGSGGPADVAP
jgi:hypothetical protein